MSFKVDESWVEAFFLIFLVLGFILSVLLDNAFLSYLSIFLGGFVAGRVYYLKYPRQPILPFVLIIVGFLLGYLIGSLWISRILALVLFALGFGISYYLHSKQIIATFKSKSFIK